MHNYLHTETDLSLSVGTRDVLNGTLSMEACWTFQNVLETFAR